MIDKAADLQRKARGRRFVGFGAMGAIGILFTAIVANAFSAAAEQRRAEQCGCTRSRSCWRSAMQRRR